MIYTATADDDATRDGLVHEAPMNSDRKAAFVKIS